MEENIFSVKLLDIILPKKFESIDSHVPLNNADEETMQHVKRSSTSDLPTMQNMMQITFIFIVMENVQTDIRKMLNSTPKTSLSEEHIVTILYNMLCALNFLHSANLIHRDLKPGNFLIDSHCNIKLCDFGLTRVCPLYSQAEIDLKALKKELGSYVAEGVTREERQTRLKETESVMTRALIDSKDQRKKDKRALSAVIMSRWYRCPEVILTYPSYN